MIARNCKDYVHMFGVSEFTPMYFSVVMVAVVMMMVMMMIAFHIFQDSNKLHEADTSTECQYLS